MKVGIQNANLDSDIEFGVEPSLEEIYRGVNQIFYAMQFCSIRSYLLVLFIPNIYSNINRIGEFKQKVLTFIKSGTTIC